MKIRKFAESDYIDDLIGQGYSLAYGLYDGDELIGTQIKFQ
jgi:aminoglycoside 6'-N-acetyltransferase I